MMAESDGELGAEPAAATPEVEAARPDGAARRRPWVRVLRVMGVVLLVVGLGMAARDGWRHWLASRVPVPAWAKGTLSVEQKLSARREGVPVARELDLGGGVTMRLVWIPPGTFTMGSPKEHRIRLFGRTWWAWGGEEGRDDDELEHPVRITRGFYMGIHEVTQAQYRALTGETPSHFEGDDRPVEQVSWNDATAFCEKLSRDAGEEARLPTEAEWEYACRAGTTTPFSFGRDESTLFRYANYADKNTSYSWSDKAHDDGYENTAPVASLTPNAWGLYDMHGNVWEWCADWYGEDYYEDSPSADPAGPAGGRSRVLRGGSWTLGPGSCRSADRFGDGPSSTYYSSGFRVVFVSAAQ